MQGEFDQRQGGGSCAGFVVGDGVKNQVYGHHGSRNAGQKGEGAKERTMLKKDDVAFSSSTVQDSFNLIKGFADPR
jgi:hypothetical protein